MNFEPALTKCYFCNEASTILIHKRGKSLKELDGKVVNMEPCPKCIEYMKLGVILITIDDAKSGAPSSPDFHWSKEKMPNPYRTGGFFVVSEDFIKRVFNPPELVAQVLKHRFSFIEHEAAEKLGLFQHVSQEKANEPQ
jgi:hypothetical protein